MPAPIIIRSSFWEGSDIGWTLAQLVGKDAEWIRLADVDGVTVIVYDAEDDSIVYDDGNGAPIAVSRAAVIFDSPQFAGGIWTEDQRGCNFAHYLDGPTVFATVAAEGGKVYRIEYVVDTSTANGSGLIAVVNLATCRPMVQT